MRRLLFLAGTLLPLFSVAQQRLHLDLFGGFANYNGDLQDRRVTLGQSGAAFGAGVRYELTRHFSARAGFMTGSIKADDKKNNAILQARNLSFKTGIFEGNLMLEYDLFDLNLHRVTPYVFGGVAVYHFNPYTYDTLGNKYFLKPLSTEGQGLAGYPDRKTYSLTQFALPFGGGVRMRVSDNIILGYEIGLRKLFTDYIDDVSTTYVDAAALEAARGTKAVELAYRGGEVKNANTVYPAEGSVRGGSKYKDWYYFQGITISIGIRGKATRGSKYGMDCPSVN